MSVDENEEKKYIRSDEAMVMLLDKMLGKISDLQRQGEETLKLVKEQVPRGIIEPLPTKTATTSVQYIDLLHQYRSLVIINDGPDDCYILVNSGKSNTTPFLLRVNEVQEVDMKTEQIYDVGLYTEAGTSEIRIRGIR